MAKGGLGRGLSALIPQRSISRPQPADPAFHAEEISEEKPSGKGGILEVSITKIEANPYQPRTVFEHSKLEELINSIKEYGILSPLIVTEKDAGKYELVAGERRLRAAKMAGLKRVPVIVREAGDLEKFELALIENIQRQDLNPIEKAEAYKKLIEEFGLTQEETAKRMGQNRSTVANILRLLNLPDEIQKALSEGKIYEGHAKLILALDTEPQQMELFRKIMSGGFSVKETEKAVKHKRGRDGEAVGKDIALKDKEEQLRGALGTKVSIDKKGTKGKISIDFYSDEELNELVRKLMGRIVV